MGHLQTVKVVYGSVDLPCFCNLTFNDFKWLQIQFHHKTDKINRIISNLLVFFALSGFPLSSQAETVHPISTPETGIIENISTVTAEARESGTHVKILGDDRIATYQTSVLASPTRVIIDIPSAGTAFTSERILVNTPDLKQIRIDYHTETIRLVFDLSEQGPPVFSTHINQKALFVIIGLRHPITKNPLLSTAKSSLSSTSAVSLPPVPAAMVEKETDPKPDNGRVFSDNLGENGDKIAAANPKSIRIKETPRPKSPMRYEETLSLAAQVQPETPRSQEEESLFLKSVRIYRTGRWSQTIENLNHLIHAFPSGAYAEKAYFLLAESHEQLYAESISDHFEDLKAYYENAIYRYPQSTHVPGAFFSIGNLFETIGSYNEAIGYYNLVAEKKEGTMLALKALMRKVNILQVKNRKEDALVLLEDIVRDYPESPMDTEAHLEMAKILFEINRFIKSLDILTRLRNQARENINRYPAIARYLGYNHYQLGHYVRARENLFKLYNLQPENEDNHLVLTKIADAYRDSGQSSHAAKLYRLVLDRYPKTEGALISLTRLAEQQEKGELNVKRDTIRIIQPIENAIDVPRKIYEDVIANLIQTDKDNPLIQLAMLRLAVIYQKEKEYDESYALLKEILKKYPRTKVKQEILYALNGALEPILNHMVIKEQYIEIINMYNREKDLVSRLKSPNLYLIIARAFDRLKLTFLATETYRRADALLQDPEKPFDLLIHLSRDEIDNRQFERASSRLNLLNGHPFSEEKISVLVYRMKGRVFMAQEQYGKAENMFSSALNHRLSRTDRIPILLDKTRALMAAHVNTGVLETMEEASRLVKRSHGEIYVLARETGDLYLQLGYPRQAISVFEHALKMVQEEDHKMRLQLAIADCYKALNKTDEYLALYKQVSGIGDSFWSDLAKERIAAQDFIRQTESAGSKK